MRRRVKLLCMAAVLVVLAEVSLWFVAIDRMRDVWRDFLAQTQASGWSVAAQEPVAEGWPFMARLRVPGIELSSPDQILPGGAAFGAEISCGVANEVGAGRLPPDFRFLRTSDVFPTNNTLLRRTALFRSGLFDLAYDRRPRADGDLGLRLYLAGATLVLNPAISVLHHHAPAGGLRTHKARTVTYALSRSRVFCRALAGVSEFYLAGRYSTRGQVRELYWHSVLGSFSLHGSLPKRTAKCLVGALLLPVTLWQLQSRLAQATDLAARFPQIPTLTRHPAANRRSTKATGESVRPAPSEICPEIL